MRSVCAQSRAHRTQTCNARRERQTNRRSRPSLPVHRISLWTTRQITHPLFARATTSQIIIYLVLRRNLLPPLFPCILLLSRFSHIHFKYYHLPHQRPDLSSTLANWKLSSKISSIYRSLFFSLAKSSNFCIHCFYLLFTSCFRRYVRTVSRVDDRQNAESMFFTFVNYSESSSLLPRSEYTKNE